MVTLSITPRSSSVPLQKKERHVRTRASAYQGICSTSGTWRETKHHQAGGKAVTPNPQDPRGPSRRVKHPLTGRWARGTLWHGIRR